MITENGWPSCGPDGCEWVTVPGTAVSLQIQKGQPLAIMRAYAADYNQFVEQFHSGDPGRRRVLAPRPHKRHPHPRADPRRLMGAPGDEPALWRVAVTYLTLPVVLAFAVIAFVYLLNAT